MGVVLLRRRACKHTTQKQPQKPQHATRIKCVCTCRIPGSCWRSGHHHGKGRSWPARSAQPSLPRQARSPSIKLQQINLSENVEWNRTQRSGGCGFLTEVQAPHQPRDDVRVVRGDILVLARVSLHVVKLRRWGRGGRRGRRRARADRPGARRGAGGALGRPRVGRLQPAVRLRLVVRAEDPSRAALFRRAHRAAPGSILDLLNAKFIIVNAKSIIFDARFIKHNANFIISNDLRLREAFAARHALAFVP